MHTHIQNVHMKRTQARLERRRCSEALHFSFVRRNQPTFRTSNARTSSLYPRPAALIPLHPPSSLPNIPQNSSKLAQLYTGPLRSCRKIGGKAVVQQSCSKRARRNLISKMIKLTLHEEARGQWEKRPNPEQPTHNHDSGRTCNIPLICTGAGPIHPVHSQPMSLATEALPETRLYFCHFPAVFT